MRGFINLFLIVIVALSINNSTAIAGNFGIGISVTESDQTIYLPVTIGEHFKAELSAGYSSYERAYESVKEENKTLEAGIGVFGTNTIYDKTQIYYGCRFIYLSREIKRFQTHANYSESFLNQTADADGYTIAPTFGFEYFLTDHISLGGEASVNYTTLETSIETIENDPLFIPIDNYETEETQKETATRVIVRYYF